jgi:membrane carboxypeptidase/penicillin-binding protein
VDIACDRSDKITAARNFVGWKTSSDGKKVYTTFRNGHKVAAHGGEGYKLAKGDEARKRKIDKVNIENDNKKDIQKEASHKKRKAEEKSLKVVLDNKSTNENIGGTSFKQRSSSSLAPESSKQTVLPEICEDNCYSF